MRRIQLKNDLDGYGFDVLKLVIYDHYLTKLTPEYLLYYTEWI